MLKALLLKYVGFIKRVSRNWSRETLTGLVACGTFYSR